MAKQKSFEDLMKEYGHTKISDADIALGKEKPQALEGILQARKDWSNAKTEKEKTAAHNKAENIRKAYGNYSGGKDGMEGYYSPAYTPPKKAAESDTVAALYEKYNSLSPKAAPQWESPYGKEISRTLEEITDRQPFAYDRSTDKLYQQYRDQYIREGRRGMADAAAQTAALTGGYGSTYGAIAAQQAYDTYLSGLNDRVPELEQYAYGKYLDEQEALFDRLEAYQGEEERRYGQYLDALEQYNTEGDRAFDQLNAAISQNQRENEWLQSIYADERDFARGVFEADRAHERQQDALGAELALETGDTAFLKRMGLDTSYLEWMQKLEAALAEEEVRKAR